MIDSYASSGALQTDTTHEAGHQRKVFKMVKGERMGGSVPVWEPAKTTKEKIQHSLNQVYSQKNEPDFETAMAYYSDGSEHVHDGETFGFGDIIDMVNPLHHVPLVGNVYRGLTGDDIKPIGKIIGGAVFGGLPGAASGLVNTIVEQETGRDIAGNVLAMAQPKSAINPSSNKPEDRLNAVAYRASDDLPGSLLSFTDLSEPSNIVIERTPAAGGRTAGTTQTVHYPDVSEIVMRAREPITEVTLSPMPERSVIDRD